MKILSSDIQLSSQSRYVRSNENTLQVLDEKGRASSTSQSRRVKEMERQDSARFISHGDTVDINRQSSGKGGGEYLYAAKTGGTLNDDLLKNSKAATAFEWAADTLDAVDDRYNQRLSGNSTSYDKDKNGWIDENDPIWEDLKVWVQDDTEKGVLKKLSETGIGAIHLGSVASEFLLEDSEGRAAGMVRASGVALTEDGQAKSVQQVDLIV